MPKRDSQTGHNSLLNISLYSEFSIDDALAESARYKAERPNERNDVNDIVYCALRRISMDDIDVVHTEFTLTLTLEQHWEDRRLQDLLPVDSNATYAIRGDSIERVWVPNLYFPLMKSGKFHELTTTNKIVFVNREWGVGYISRLTLTQTCSLDLRLFPFDVQRFDTHLSAYMYTVDEIELRWLEESKQGQSSWLIVNNVPQFNLYEDEPLKTSNFTISEVYFYNYTFEFSALNASIYFYRGTSSFILTQVSIPFLLTVLSWVNYFLDPEQTAARVSLGITTVLSAVTQASTAQRGLPQLQYNTMLDIWTAVCLEMTILGLIEYAVVHILVFRAKRFERMISQQTTSTSVSPEHITESSFITERKMDTRRFSSSERILNDDGSQADLPSTTKTLRSSAIRYRLWAHRIDLTSRIIMPVGLLIALCTFAIEINLLTKNT
ncbi:glycine receptor subunit alpha-2-like [Asterias amurensis]|uniref:glycine receptor subunit alpha-2-like n=1 Tax=Asterias amurensis TaxID=7602 RepID=UPI003AB1AB7A